MSNASTQHYFFRKGFFSLFWTQFVGALNDNFFKNAIVIQITYIIAVKKGIDPSQFVTMAAGIFILPFFLFSANAGLIADTSEKSKLIRMVKLAEIFIMALAAFGFNIENISVLMWALFLMGAQSALFGPLKYSLLPIFLKDEELVRGNGLVNSATFIAILLGTIGGSYLILVENGELYTNIVIIGVALLGWLFSMGVPEVQPEKNMQLSWGERLNFITVTWRLCRETLRERVLRKTLVGVSWFWFIGASILSQLPTFISINLGADNIVYMVFLGLFAVGIGLGALACSRFIHRPTVKYVPVSLLVMTFFFVCYYFSFSLYDVPALPEGTKLGLVEVFSEPSIYPMTLAFVMIAFSGGVFIIPQFSLTQQVSAPEARSQVIAVNNVLNSMFMVISAVVILVMNIVSLPIPLILLSIGLLNLVFLVWWKLYKIDEKYSI